MSAEHLAQLFGFIVGLVGVCGLLRYAHARGKRTRASGATNPLWFVLLLVLGVAVVGFAIYLATAAA